MRMTRTLCGLAIAVGLSGLSAVTEAQDIVINGSFENGTYSGWMLYETSVDPSAGTWGIAGDGQTIVPGEEVLDWHDGIMVAEYSPGLPITYEATDGVFVALQLQLGIEQHRMFQDVFVPAGVDRLCWDMFYTNWSVGATSPPDEELIYSSFDENQYFAINIRDAVSDVVVETLFKTVDGDPLSVPMTGYCIAIGHLAGETVRIDFELNNLVSHFDLALDRIRTCSTSEPDCDNQPLFADDFESGDFSAWSVIVPLN